MKHGTVFFLLILLHPCVAQALCVNLAFGDVPSLATFVGGSAGYAVYDTQEYLQTATFKVRGEATGATCEYFVTLSEGQSGNAMQRTLSRMTNTLNYNVYVDSGKKNVFKPQLTATSSEVITGSFPVAIALTQTNSHSFFWTINPQQIVPTSTMPYDDSNLTLSLYAGTLSLSPTLVETKTITFRAQVDSSIDVSLVESGKPFDIGNTTQLVNFGILESGADRSIDVVVRSNSGYKVTMQSQNRQLLLHSQSPRVADTVAYSVIFNGGGVDLSTGAAEQVISGTGTTPATGATFPIEFTIGTLSGNEPAGSYSDIIYVEVIAD